MKLGVKIDAAQSGDRWYNFVWFNISDYGDITLAGWNWSSSETGTYYYEEVNRLPLDYLSKDVVGPGLGRLYIQLKNQVDILNTAIANIYELAE